MVSNCARLVRSFRILELPILVTEQYPQGLGQTVAELREALGEGEAPLAKTCFSSCGIEEFRGRLTELHVEHALVCGIETHVCVSQTVHDLLQMGIEVHLAVDASESRNAIDREVALQKMERSGAILTTSEAAVFEILADAKHPEFRKVQALFK